MSDRKRTRSCLNSLLQGSVLGHFLLFLYTRPLRDVVISNVFITSICLLIYILFFLKQRWHHKCAQVARCWILNDGSPLKVLPRLNSSHQRAAPYINDLWSHEKIYLNPSGPSTSFHWTRVNQEQWHLRQSLGRVDYGDSSEAVTRVSLGIFHNGPLSLCEPWWGFYWQTQNKSVDYKKIN